MGPSTPTAESSPPSAGASCEAASDNVNYIVFPNYYRIDRGIWREIDNARDMSGIHPGIVRVYEWWKEKYVSETTVGTQTTYTVFAESELHDTSLAIRKIMDMAFTGQILRLIQGVRRLRFNYDRPANCSNSKYHARVLFIVYNSL